MNPLLQQRLFDAGPILYDLRNRPMPECRCMDRGIECPDDWFIPLMILTQILEFHNQQNPNDVIHASQVKTKLNHLRFHADRFPDDENDFLDYIIAVFEENIKHE